MKKVIFNWSGGKDSALCLYRILQGNQYEVDCLVTTINSRFRRVSMHSVREDLLDIQTGQIGLPLHKIFLPHEVSMQEYDSIMRQELQQFKEKGIQHAVFGDIFLKDLRAYREQRLDEIDIKARFPLWKKSTVRLADEFINLGFKAIVVCVDASKLDKSFAGRIYNDQFLQDLPEHTDPCGENGEFHTYVYDGPIFGKPLAFKKGNIVYRWYPREGNTDNRQRSDSHSAKDTVSGFWFCDLAV